MLNAFRKNLALPKLISLVPQRFEDGGWSGVPRFDWELRQVFPSLRSMNTRWCSIRALRRIAKQEPDTIVITGNETSLLVPENLRTVVVHHGCAQTHYNRDPTWRGRAPRRLCLAQQKMYYLPNRWFVAAAKWTAHQFSAHYQVPLAPVIPNWVSLIKRHPVNNVRPVVLGDWRTFNKGQHLIDQLNAKIANFEFRSLVCTYENRSAAYQSADCYLCLSLSEGGAYSMSDAEAATLPIITTDVGNCLEYHQSRVFPWEQRDNVQIVHDMITQALNIPRGPSFFELWTRERWTAAWHLLIQEVADTQHKEPFSSDT